jgi:hypothetical protein
MLTKEQFIELREVMNTITTHIPDHQTGYIWDMYNKIDGNHGGKPCTCSSSARYWRAAVDTLKNYVKSNNDNW